VAAALVAGAVLILAQGFNPLTVYGALLTAAVGGTDPIRSLANTSFIAIPLVLTGLSASIAFASGAVNLGQPGQFLAGAMAAAVIGLVIPAPTSVILPLMLAAAMAAGVLWAGVAAGLRVRFGLNEFIVTLLLNSIADRVTLWLISGPLLDPAAFTPSTRALPPGAQMPHLGAFDAGLLVVPLVLAFLWWVDRRTVIGYEWRLTGQNALFTRLGGVPVEPNFIRVMVLSGALAGLAGALLVVGGPGRFLRGIGANYAWDGIMIAVIANNGLIGTMLYGLFFAGLQSGAIGMELFTALPSEFILVLQAVMVLLVVAGRSAVQSSGRPVT
jgi:simple sugar transport system permease protein